MEIQEKPLKKLQKNISEKEVLLSKKEKWKKSDF